MYRKSLNSFLFAVTILGFLEIDLRAEIITDIGDLDKPKDKKESTKPDDKPVPSQPETSPTPAPTPSVSPATSKEAPAAQPDPNATKALREKRSNAPIHLQSDGTSTYSRDRSIVQLEKNVLITQDDMRLQSNEAKVFLMASESAEGNGVKSAELTGKVSISRSSKDPTERMNARSDRAIFDNNAQIVTLEGNARLWRDGNLIKGEKITYEITTGMIKVDRAQGVVQPDKVKP